jgi:hypothetical protein
MGRKGEVEASTAGKTFKAAAKAANSAADSLIVPAAVIRPIDLPISWDRLTQPLFA